MVLVARLWLVTWVGVDVWACGLWVRVAWGGEG